MPTSASGRTPTASARSVYPALARVPARPVRRLRRRNVNGDVYAAGDADAEFTIMSVSKPFVFALVCQALGAEPPAPGSASNATGLPFNSLEAVERSADGRTNPMVNAGAIATTSLVPAQPAERVAVHPRRPVALRRPRADARRRGVRLARRRRTTATASIARLLQTLRPARLRPGEAVDLYTRQCSLEVTAQDLAVMGATLADGGVNPLTRRAGGRRRRPAGTRSP